MRLQALRLKKSNEFSFLLRETMVGKNTHFDAETMGIRYHECSIFISVTEEELSIISSCSEKRMRVVVVYEPLLKNVAMCSEGQA